MIKWNRIGLASSVGAKLDISLYDGSVKLLSLLVGQPIIFPLFEILVLEPLRYYTRHRHEAFCRVFHNELKANEKE